MRRDPRPPTTTCLALIREHGLPTVLKVDIEGLDRACVESLAADPAARPRYVMIEDKSAMDLLTSPGYTRFKLQHGYSVAQARVAPRALAARRGRSSTRRPGRSRGRRPGDQRGSHAGAAPATPRPLRRADGAARR